MLTISDRNLWVMLHRARMAVRECLEVSQTDARGVIRPAFSPFRKAGECEYEYDGEALGL